MMFNKLTPAEIEQFNLIAEECGEGVQAIMKALRHGLHSRHPDDGPSNKISIEKEMGDIICAISICCEHGPLDREAIINYARYKRQRVTKYLHHQLWGKTHEHP